MTTQAHRRSLWLPVGALAIALLVPFTTMLVAAWLFGWRFQPVESASMAPAMPRGTLAIVQPADPSRVVPGTIVVFADPVDPSRLIAHRIVRALPGSPPRWETRGDANEAIDSRPVPVTAVQGIVAWNVPGLGSAVTTLRGMPAVLLLVVLPLAILALTEIDGYRRRRTTPAAG